MARAGLRATDGAVGVGCCWEGGGASGGVGHSWGPEGDEREPSPLRNGQATITNRHFPTIRSYIPFRPIAKCFLPAFAFSPTDHPSTTHTLIPAALQPCAHRPRLGDGRH